MIALCGELIIQTAANLGASGIYAPSNAARTAAQLQTAGCDTSAYYPSLTSCQGDDIATNYTIRNNTLYFSANSNKGMNGIHIGSEGSGYTVVNNTITYASTTSGGDWNDCFDFALPLSSYARIDNNNCYSAYTGQFNYWELNSKIATLTDWQGQGFGASSSDTDAQLTFTALPVWSDDSFGYDLYSALVPSSGSPLYQQATAGPTYDIRGTTTLRPAHPTIGAYEP